MYSKRTAEEKEKIIDKIARIIVKLKLESLSILILDTIRPASGWLVPTFMITASPIMFGLELFNIESWEIGIIFSSPENIEALIKKVEQLTGDL